MRTYKVSFQNWPEEFITVKAVDPYHAAEKFCAEASDSYDVDRLMAQEVMVSDQLGIEYYLTVFPEYQVNYTAYDRK